MNKLIIIFLLSTLCAFGKVAAPNIEVKTNGLVCNACGIGIKKWLKKNPSVNEVKLDTEKGLTLIFLKQDKNITDKQIRIAIRKAGYEAKGIKRNP